MASLGNILIVDDEKDIRFLLREILDDEGYSVAEAPHSEAAYAHIAAHGMPDLVILDIWLENSDRDGMEILSDLKKRSDTLPVLMISGHGNIEMAVRAIKLGAFDFIEKPFNTDRLLHLVARAFDVARRRAGGAQAVSLAAVAPETQALLKSAQKAAGSDARVLVTGAWGAGRTHLARYIHQESERAARPFVAPACAQLGVQAMAEALAGEGSVVFRDVQALPPALQTELLARLNARPEARVMATATPALESMRADGSFLPDLYERLSVVSLRMPLLEERRADLPELCAALLHDLASQWGCAKGFRLSDDALGALRQTRWEWGQANALRALLGLGALRARADGLDEIRAAHLSAEAPARPAPEKEEGLLSWLENDLRRAREQFERWYFEQLMDRFEGSVSQVAAFAGMDRTALHRKLKSLKEGGSKDDADTEAA